MSYNWPWTWDSRPRGWFTANGMTKFGPLPLRERSDEQWPPRVLEEPQTAADKIKAWRERA